MAVDEADLKVDRTIAQLLGKTPLLSLVTPTNVSEERRRFLADRQPPLFEYRPLPDLHEIEDQLSDIRSEDATDPTIALLAEGLIRELRLRLDMLRRRGTESFFLTSVEMFGHIDEPTLALALQILDRTPIAKKSDKTVDSEQFAALAVAELDHYRATYPEVSARVIIAETVTGVMVETGDLYVGADVRIARGRVLSLLQHEVGTHIVTYENGRAQPLQMLGLGLASYDELQEALGILAEFLAGNLPPSRLRVLAHRVVAADLRSNGADFIECFDRLEELGASPTVAFNTTMRAYRSGGMTKDAIYLRGLVRLLEHLNSGAELSSLFVGKISFETIPLVKELGERGVLTNPPLRPRFLEMEDADTRLEDLRQRGLEALGGVAA